MRILKYLFLLLLLSFVAFCVLIATLKKIYTIEQSKIIDSKRSSVYAYASELKNLKDWNTALSGIESSATEYSNRTTGTGSFCKWDGLEGINMITTINQIKEDSIQQTINLNGITINLTTRFLDTLGKTKVTMKITGELNYISKLTSFFDAGNDIKMEQSIANSLVNLNKKLNYELKSHSTELKGLVTKLKVYYMSQTFTTTFDKIDKNRTIVFTKINNFCLKNDLQVKGKPFLLYHTYDNLNKQTKVSVCVPIKEPIFTATGSEYLCDSLPSFTAVKTTLQGNYLFANKARSQTLAYIKENNLKRGLVFSHLEIYQIGKNEINIPSKWLTFFYYPIQPKKVFQSATKKLPTSENVNSIKEEEKTGPSEF